MGGSNPSTGGISPPEVAQSCREPIHQEMSTRAVYKVRLRSPVTAGGLPPRADYRIVRPCNIGCGAKRLLQRRHCACILKKNAHLAPATGHRAQSCAKQRPVRRDASQECDARRHSGTRCLLAGTDGTLAPVGRAFLMRESIVEAHANCDVCHTRAAHTGFKISASLTANLRTHGDTTNNREVRNR